MSNEITAQAHKPTDAHAQNDADQSEYLTFMLGDEAYGVDILKVQEIRGYGTVTPIPNAPDFIKGVINLRGTIVPVLDLRLKFKLPQAEYDGFTVMIILNVAQRVVGVVVDSVSDVINLGAEQIKPAPEFSGALKTDYITGLGTVDEQMLILMDIEKLIGAGEMGLADTATVH